MVRFHGRVAFAACFSGCLFVLRLGEILWRTSGVDLPWIFRLSLFILSASPSPFGPVGHFGAVLWRLGTILWHILGFSTDTYACFFLREPQHVTAIGNLADCEAQ